MLQELGLTSVADLFADIPEEVRLRRPLDLPAGMAEPEVARLLEDLAAANRPGLVCFLGGGAYDHYVPAVVGHLLNRGEFLTAYTPYQPEISQGTLQVMYEFQTMICTLTGLDVASASIYDGASALAEAALMAFRATGRRRVLVARAVHPRHRQVLRTYLAGPGLAVEEVPWGATGAVDPAEVAARLDEDVAAVIVQEPNFFGVLEPVRAIGEIARRRGALFIASVNPVSLGLLEPPAAYGADVAVGEGQPLGCGLSFGGPYLGFLAAREALLRQMPGRLAGATVDAAGRRGFVLTLQAREQHIRRERATSNICTNQALMALAATVYLSWLGKEGLAGLARLCLQKAHYAAARVAAVPGFHLPFRGAFFHEFVVRSERPVPEVLAGLRERGILGGLDLAPFYPELAGHFLVCVTEKRTRAEIEALAAGLAALGPWKDAPTSAAGEEVAPCSHRNR